MRLVRDWLGVQVALEFIRMSLMMLFSWRVSCSPYGFIAQGYRYFSCHFSCSPFSSLTRWVSLASPVRVTLFANTWRVVCHRGHALPAEHLNMDNKGCLLTPFKDRARLLWSVQNKNKVILGYEFFLVLSVGRRSEMGTLQIIPSCPCTDSIHLECVTVSLHNLLILALELL